MINRTRVAMVMLCVMCMGLVGCSKEKPEPQISNIRNICELATLEAYYQEVLEATNDKNKWFTGYKCWLEYEGTVKVGVDMSRIDMDVDGNKVRIFMPKAEVLSINFNEDSCRVAANAEGIFTRGANVDEMIKQGQEDMENKVKNDEELLQRGQERAKEMIENYIKSFGKINGKEYIIEWKEIS